MAMYIPVALLAYLVCCMCIYLAIPVKYFLCNYGYTYTCLQFASYIVFQANLLCPSCLHGCTLCNYMYVTTLLAKPQIIYYTYLVSYMNIHGCYGHALISVGLCSCLPIGPSLFSILLISRPYMQQTEVHGMIYQYSY